MKKIVAFYPYNRGKFLRKETHEEKMASKILSVSERYEAQSRRGIESFHPFW